jgi:phosphoribosylformimino-5-aminoimidazole carboxamide ribotide isomerase
MQLIPAIDLLNGAAVRLLKGDFNQPLWRADAVEYAQSLVTRGATRLHIVDLDGARSGAPNWPVLQSVFDALGSIPCQVGGGIRSHEVASRALELGAERVIIGTAALADEEALRGYATTFGEQLVIAVDVRDGIVATHGWLTHAGLSFDTALTWCREAGVRRILCTAVDRDGTLSGPDEALLTRAVSSGIAVIAAGGIRSHADVDAVAAIGCEAAVSGLAVATGMLDIPSYEPAPVPARCEETSAF